jgi:hypothetical protein
MMCNPVITNIRIIAAAMRAPAVCVVLLASLATPAIRAQGITRAADDDGGELYSLHRMDTAVTLAGSTEPLSSCGDALSAALQQGTPQFPCWANIRTVDRWNSASIGWGISTSSGQAMISPHDVPSSFTFTGGGLSAFSLPGDGQGKAYGGLAAMSGLLERRRWQLMAEDAGGTADFQLSGGHFVGLNLSAVRLTGEITPRLTWQGSATNTYGTDAARQVAPLDYRMIGDSDAPAPDTAAYGLHGGLMTEGEEGIKLRYETSRSSTWDFSAADNYTKYNADAFLVHTERARIEYLHTALDGTALGFYGNGGHQSDSLACSLGGAGMRLLSSWNSHATLSLSGGIAGANPSCGKRVQFIGDAALYTRLTSRTDFYLTARRDLGDGVLEQTVFLSTGGAGIRHSFGRKLDVHASVNDLRGVDRLTKQTYHGSFVDGSLHYRLWRGFSQEMELRRFSFSGLPAEAGRTVGVFTLWWSPPRHAPAEEQQRAALR